jgi:transcriptional regulator with XRE-family HTH domain
MKFNRAALTFAREQAGLSKPQLSKKAKVGLATVYDLESGQVQTPQTRIVARLAEACNVDWRLFFEDAFRQEESPTPAA